MMLCVTRGVNLINVNKDRLDTYHHLLPKLALFSRQHPSQRTTANASLQPIASTDNRHGLNRRVSRTDLDFEQALRQEGTFVLKEGIDVNSLGVDNSPANRSISTPTTRAISRVALQPATPTVVPPTPSPALTPAPPTPMPFIAPSPASSSYDLAVDADEAERQLHRRSLYRSPGTSSSPDLATLLRRARERGSPAGGPAGKKEKGKEREREVERERRREGKESEREAHGERYDQQTLRQPTGMYSSTTLAAPSPFGERTREEEWVMPSSGRQKGATVKAPKSSVRAKTSALWGKMMGQGTARERSKTDASIHPASQTLMNAFAPPVPAIPQEHRSPVHSSPVADMFSTTTTTITSNTKRPLPSRKPLPDIMTPPHKHSDDTDRSIVLVEKQDSPLPPLPNSSPAPITPKRRSNSVSNDARLPPLLPLVLPISATAPQTPENPRVRKGSDSTFGGLLDVFKGELSVLDPISLDLRDPSTPPRPVLRTDLSPRDDRAASNAAASVSAPTSPSTLSAGSPTSLDASLSVIVPPRSSSLQGPAPRYPLTGHASSARLPQQQQQQQGPGSTPLRSRSGPITLAANNQVYRDGTRLRVQHRSTASSSEPSLIAAMNGESSTPTSFRDSTHGPVEFDALLARGAAARVVPTALRRGSEHDLALSPDSVQFSTAASTPIITSEDQGDDLETRGKELATRCWSENEDFLAKEKIAEWLGGYGQINSVALKYYIDMFDFAGLRLDLAFRRLCGKLFLKGETQQVDRILEQFSRRYWECNPTTLYGSANFVHAIAYSLLLLNTDLHVAELTARMSRSQFVRNTMAAIQMQLQPSPDPASYPSPNPSAQLSTTDLTYDDCGSSIRAPASDETDIRTVTRTTRSNSTASWNSVPHDVGMSMPLSPPSTASSQLGAGLPNGSTQSVHTADHSTSARQPITHGRAWESEMEILLKDMYGAIKSQQILQPLTTSVTRSSMSSLSPGGGGMLRNRSLRAQPDRLTTLKRGSFRGLQSILNAQSGASPYSSNSSIDGRVSPSPSFATSTHEAMYGSSSSFLNPALGFASNLSNTIREAQEDDDQSVHSEDSASTTISISDEELALLGAPWAKEGMLCRKQYWESAGKRAKDKGWLDVFVVIQKGKLNMFIFGDYTSVTSGTFGGGNWLANAHPVGAINLAHSLAHALPPPGYHKRPHCMVLTMASRGVYFFQAGTEELVNEWVSTCNYWAARTSKEPLAGGVSNMEYGWNRVADVYGNDGGALQADLHREEFPDSISVRSGKSTRSKYSWRDVNATVRGNYPSPRADKTYINEWKAPLPPTVASVHDEETQLDALKKHVASLKQDLGTHNELREPMSALYPARTANAMKAQSNWEEKSQYLLREIVKYDLYIDSLQAAISLRLKKRGEKALEHALGRANPVDDPTAGAKGFGLHESISEEAEPITPNARDHFAINAQRRETADDGDGADD